MKPFMLAFLVAIFQTASAPFTVDQILSFPSPENLVASPVGSTIAWTFNERGVRNIYVADGPEFAARRVTSYTEDDGQELTQLSFSGDGKNIVYVRGGDHGSNRQGEAPPNPAELPIQPRIQIWAVAAAGGSPKLIADGDSPVTAPDGDRIAFVRDRRIWFAPIDGSKVVNIFLPGRWSYHYDNFWNKVLFWIRQNQLLFLVLFIFLFQYVLSAIFVVIQGT